MGKIKDIIARVDDGKFNEYSDQLKLRWLSLLDGQIAAEVYLMAPQEVAQYAYPYPDGLEMSPLVDFPNDDIYDLWLTAQIDFNNGEYEKYQNTMEMFNSVYGRFVNWFLTYKAPEKFLGEKGKEIGGGPFYYITAYGLAVKQGFTGTMEQWLESLIGPTPEIQIGNVTTVPYGKPAEVSLRGSALNPIFDFAIPRGLSDLDTNFGEGNNTGLLGYYYSAIDFENKTVTLSTEQGKAVVPEEIAWAVGDVVSIVNGGKYEQCAAIVGINGHVLTLDNIPFDKLDPTIKDFDDRSIYVSAKPEAGVVDLGKGAIAMGVHNKSLNRGAVALGEDNEVTAQYGTAIGRLNKVHGYAGFANGRENIVHPGAKYGRASGLKNEVWGEESIAEGHECKAYAKGAKATGYKTVANGEFSETAGHQSETIAEAKYAYAGGHESRAEAAFSHVTGLRNISRVQGQLVGGRYNEPKNNEVFTIGCGTSKDNRQNALSVRMDGTTDVYGHKITNVADGTAAGDAVNKRQLDTKAPAGYGLGGDAKEFAWADVDNITANGWYLTSGASIEGYDDMTNWCYMFVECWNHESCTQTLHLSTRLNVSLKRSRNVTGWGEWEWENPPMIAGVEYRTTERYNGKPVYIKRMNYGQLPNNNYRSINLEIGKYIPFWLDGVVKSSDGAFATTFSSAPSISANFALGTTDCVLTVETFYDYTQNGYSAEVVFKYTK